MSTFLRVPCVVGAYKQKRFALICSSEWPEPRALLTPTVQQRAKRKCGLDAYVEMPHMS